jgi:hypothetical protein
VSQGNPLTGTNPSPPLANAPQAEGEEAYFITREGNLHRVLSTRDFLSPINQSVEERVPTPGRGFLLSALVPGTGQRVLGQERWVAYLAGEVWAWVQYLERRREGRNLQDRYRDLAWLVARRVSSGPRVDGNFEYYESMTKFQASGAYDIDPDELGVQPEPDPETFNGSMWALARQIFFLDDPDAPVEIGSDQYKKALRYYLSRAYAPELAWNWSDNTLQQAEFSHLIQESDENLRRSTTMVGVILANHLLSSVDALVSGRLLQERSQEPLLELSLLPGPFHRDGLALSIRIPHRLGHGS